MGLVGTQGLELVPSLLGFYALAYVLLVCAAAFVLNCLPQRVTRGSGGSVLFAALAALRLRWVWLLVVTNLAGLPPAFFFGPKLGLFALLMEGGVFFLALALGLSVLLGWGAYYALGQQMLIANSTLSVRPLGERTLPTGLASCATVLGLFLVFGLILLDDLFIFSVWVGV